jgi:hypothetical protein
MTRLDASDLAQRLGREAEAVCRHYLDAGHRQGNYWQVGDARNTPGRSMFVRLKETAKGPAGKWTEHVAARVMLRWRGLARFCLGFRGAGQHNLGATGGCS